MKRPKRHVCNKCGKSCVPEAARKQGIDDLYGLKAIFNSGYFSEKFPDGNIYKFKICEKCLSEFMDTFIKPAKIKPYI